LSVKRCYALIQMHLQREHQYYRETHCLWQYLPMYRIVLLNVLPSLLSLSLSLSSHTKRTILTSVCLVNSVSFVRIHLMFSLIYFIFPTLFVHISPAKMFPDREPIMILINGVEIYLNYTKIYLQRRTILLLTLHH